jgi:hypothetical protein
MSIKGLENMYHPDEKLFCHRITQGSNAKMKQERVSLRYTAIALIGLYEARRRGYENRIDLSLTMERLTGIALNMDSFDGYGDLSLILWANLLSEKRYFEDIWSKAKEICKSFYIEDNTFPSMETAWLLIALCHLYEISDFKLEVKKLISIVYKRLINNFHPSTSLFSFQNRVWRKNLVKMKIYSSLGSFASQIYPIMALSIYSKTFDNDEAKDIAIRCADKICSLQGEKGQWWWIYNVEKGNVAEKYPVYSVHQDAMAPMALFALQDVMGSKKFEDNIYKGLTWLFGINELGENLVDFENNIIWRAIQRKEWGKTTSFGLGLLGHLNMKMSAFTKGHNFGFILDRITKLKILRESRPYHLGWLLLALSKLA